MDTYSRIVLTVIAALLVVIVVKLWQQDARVTFGDFMTLRELDVDERVKSREALLKEIPFVQVYGTVDVSGSVDVTGSVDIDNTVDVVGSVEVENIVYVTGSVDCY